MMQEKKKIVFIDPDTRLTEDLQRRFMLEPDFIIESVSTTGVDGIAKIQAGQPDFAIIATPLPDGEAMQLLNNISMISPQTKKVISLETENPMLMSQYMQSGADHVLIKPYTADKLIETLKIIEKRPSTPMGQVGVGMGGGMDMGTSPSLEQLRGAMAQFEEERNQGTGGFQGVGMQDGNFNQPQQMQQPMQGYQMNQMGNMGQQNQQNFTGGGFPPPQMPQMAGGGAGNQMPYNNMQMPNQQMMGGMQASAEQRKGGFRTLKQTVIAVNCPKGGVGKTTVSKELAIAYATCKVNGQPLKVCLVDCDLDFGDVTSMLKMNPYPNITHWTSDIRQRLKENPSGDIRYTQQQLEDNYLITHPTGLKILAAPSSHTDALDITGKEIEIVVDNLKACDFDIIILDTGNNTKDYTLIALDKAHIVLMITTLEVTTINDTSLLLNTLRSIQFPTNKIQLVVNKMPKSDKDIDVSEIAQVLRAPIIGIIPDNPKIRQLNNAGSPAMLGKETEFTDAIRKIGNQIVPVFNKAIPPKGGGKSGGGGFFSRLFGK